MKHRTIYSSLVLFERLISLCILKWIRMKNLGCSNSSLNYGVNGNHSEWSIWLRWIGLDSNLDCARKNDCSCNSWNYKFLLKRRKEMEEKKWSHTLDHMAMISRSLTRYDAEIALYGHTKRKAALNFDDLFVYFSFFSSVHLFLL